MQIEEIIHNAQNICLVDVREKDELFISKHPKALHLPYSQLIEGIIPGTLPKNKLLVLFCRSGRRAKHAAEILQKQAFTTCAVDYSVDDLTSLCPMNTTSLYPNNYLQDEKIGKTGVAHFC